MKPKINVWIIIVPWFGNTQVWPHVFVSRQTENPYSEGSCSFYFSGCRYRLVLLSNEKYLCTFLILVAGPLPLLFPSPA